MIVRFLLKFSIIDFLNFIYIYLLSTYIFHTSFQFKHAKKHLRSICPTFYRSHRIRFTRRKKNESTHTHTHTRVSSFRILKSRGIQIWPRSKVKGIFDPRPSADSGRIRYRVLMKASRMSCQPLLEPRGKRGRNKIEREIESGEAAFLDGLPVGYRGSHRSSSHIQRWRICFFLLSDP